MKKILALLLALAMVMALAACGGGAAEEPAAAPVEDSTAAAVVPEAAAPEAAAVEDSAPAEAPAEAPAGDASGEMASGEASGAPSGDPPEGTHPDAELMEPTADYSKDLDGYKAYAIDALKSDPNAPAASVDEMVANIEAATDPTDDAFRKLTDPGRILPYEDFLAF